MVFLNIAVLAASRRCLSTDSSRVARKFSTWGLFKWHCATNILHGALNLWKFMSCNFGQPHEDKPTIYSLYLIKWWGAWYCRRCHFPTLWAFFSIASCRSLLSRSSLSLLSLRLSLTRRDLHQKVIYEKKMALKFKLNMRRPASTLPACSFLFPASFLFHLHM